MRYVVNFESQDDCFEFARVLDNVNRHIEFTYTIVKEESCGSVFPDPMYLIETTYCITLEVMPVSKRSVTLRHMGNGLVRVTVRRSNGTILLETDTHTSEAYKPTEMRNRLCGMAAAFSQKVTSKHAGISTDWELLAYEFESLTIPVVIPVESEPKQTLTYNGIDQGPVATNEDLSQITFTCSKCGPKGQLEMEYEEVICRTCDGYCRAKYPSGRSVFD